jgi:IclR family transcriptional regulator, KDG regulon repressor
MKADTRPDQRARRVAGDDSHGSRGVHRVFEIFDLMLERGEPLTVAQIVDDIGIPKSTAYELVRALTKANYLAPSGRGNGFGLGRKLFELGMAYRNQIDLIKDGSRIAEELRDATGETVQMSVLEDQLMLVLLKEEGSRSLRIISQVGSRVPVNWAAAGRLLVSDLDDGELRNLLVSTVRQSPTGNATTDPDRLIAEIRTSRRQGYASELNQANEHAGCVAAPVLDSTGRCIAALSIVVPEQRLNEPNREHLIAAVRNAAAKLSHRLGG